jgi:lipoprotein-releasing system permease protein
VNLEHFIAKRLIAAKGRKSSISAPIIKIAIAAIAIGMVMMIVSVATGIGLQQKSARKFRRSTGTSSSRITTTTNRREASHPFLQNRIFTPSLKPSQASVTFKQWLLKQVSSAPRRPSKESSLKALVPIMSGATSKNTLCPENCPMSHTHLNAQVMISQYLSDRLDLKVGDKFNTFFMKDDGNRLPNLRVFEVVGIYNSGFQELIRLILLVISATYNASTNGASTRLVV